MTQQNNSGVLYKSLIWTTALYALTAFHHYYGSVVYKTPWRAHVLPIGGAVLLICILFAALYKVYHRRIWLNVYLLVALVVFGLLIGLVEGFYNHMVKNILYFSGLNIVTWRSMFPAPAYEIPENFIFESTGVLQFLIGLVQIYFLSKVYFSK